MAERTWDIVLIIAALATASVVLAAMAHAADRIDPLGSDEPAAVDEPVPSETHRCEAPRDGYAIEYPAGWKTNDDGATLPCRAFDPDLPELDPATELPLDAAVIVTTTGGEFGPFSAELDDVSEQDPTVDVERIEMAEVAGRDAIVVDAVSTGDGMIGEGVAFRSYYIDLDDRIVVASSYDLGDPDFDEKLDALDAMVETIEPIEPS